MMSKKTLNIVLVSLLVVNIATLSILWMKPGRGHKKPKGDRLIHKLSFDESQQEAFFNLKDEHHHAAEELQRANHEIREQYSTLMVSNDLSDLDSLTALLGANVAKLESLHFRHFQDIRELCKGDQVEKFDRMMKDMHGGRPGPPPPPGGPAHRPKH